MPTPTIPERDEEKEFIQHQLWKLFGKEGTEQLYLEDVKHCMGKVAAFSARRAKEKAIEECKNALMPCWAEDGTGDCTLYARLSELLECFEELKSQPQ